MFSFTHGVFCWLCLLRGYGAKYGEHGGFHGPCVIEDGGAGDFLENLLVSWAKQWGGVCVLCILSFGAIDCFDIGGRVDPSFFGGYSW